MFSLVFGNLIYIFFFTRYKSNFLLELMQEILDLFEAGKTKAARRGILRLCGRATNNNLFSRFLSR